MIGNSLLSAYFKNIQQIYLSSSQVHIHVCIQGNEMYGMFHEPPQSFQQVALLLAPTYQCSVLQKRQLPLRNNKVSA